MPPPSPPAAVGADPSSLDGDYEAFRPAPDSVAPTVLQLLPALRSGGVERGTVDVARALVQAGWRAIVASAGGGMVHELERAGARHVTLPVGDKNPLVWRANFDRLVDLIYQENVDLVHARSRMPAWIGWRAARRYGLPFVTTFHGRYGDSNVLKKIYNGVMVRGDRVIAISHYIANGVARRYRFDTARLRVIPRGVDLALYDPDRVGAERMVKLATRWRLPDGVPVIMLPGRLTRWKGHAVLIDALATMQDLPVHCLMVGPYDGKQGYKDALEARAARLGIGGRVALVGACEDMPAAYKLADVVISASVDPEPFGRVVIEGQAMGRPVLATDHGGAAESMIVGVAGWLVPPQDPAALAGALRRALTLPAAERQRMAGTAIGHARANFSKHDMCWRTLSVYAEVLDQSPRFR